MNNEEDFSDLCKPETQAQLHDLIHFYSQPQHHSEDALRIFRGMQREAEAKCGFIVRSMFEQQNQKPKEKLRTMIGYSQYEINDNGSLSLIPEPQPKKSKVPDPTPECMLMLEANDKKRRDES